MKSFDQVPVMDREYFEQCLGQATSFAIWVQVNPALQRLVPITKEDALDIANDGLSFGYIWGQLSDGCLELSLTSQWLDRISKDEDERQAAIRILDDMKHDRLQGDQDRRPSEVLAHS